MLKNYFLIAFRNIRRNRIFSLLNIIGLAIGIAACLLIAQYVAFQNSFDSFHSAADKTYRVDIQSFQNGEDEGVSSFSTYLLAPTLMEKVPAIEAVTRLHYQYGGAIVTANRGNEQKQFFEEQMYYADQPFFEIFDYKLLKGDKDRLLTDPKSMVITESMAQKYFPGNSDVVGKFLKVDGGWMDDTYKITGLLEDFPSNSQLDIDFIMPIDDLLKNQQYVEDNGWDWSNFYTFAMLDENASEQHASDGMKNIIMDIQGEHLESDNREEYVVLTPFLDIHLNDPADDYELASGVDQQSVNLFAVIALFIILIAWLNYVNLATAQAIKRAKEVGIRKVIGAVKKQLVAQFLLEAFTLNFISLTLAFGIAYLCIPLLSELISKEMALGVGITSQHWVYFILAFIIGSFLSGLYPAFILSNYKPVVVIKGAIGGASKKFGLRQSLVIIQMVIGMFLITGTFTVYRQLNFMRNHDLGLNVDQVLVVNSPKIYKSWDDVKPKIANFKQELKNLTSVSQVSSSDAVPGGDYNWGTRLTKQGQDVGEAKPVKFMFVDDNFSETYEIELLAGRFHDKEIKGNRNEVVVNKTLLEKFDIASPEEAIGVNMIVGDNQFPIIGVLEDYHWYGLQMEKDPIVLRQTNHGGFISVKINTQDLRGSMSQIEALYSSFFPGNPFDHYFMDDFFNRQYENDQTFGKIFSAFSIVAIVVTCLGLFGLASFTLSQRVKEISVRKVLGASVKRIMLMIYKDYLILIVISSSLSLPIIYFAINSWLEFYAYRISLTMDVLIIPVIILIVIAVLSVSYQTLRAATTNPATSLRSE
ncbi:MAG: ABC transporter permease [Cyclobacteriaceae bacterium]